MRTRYFFVGGASSAGMLVWNRSGIFGSAVFTAGGANAHATSAALSLVEQKHLVHCIAP
jgi:hypothetical protein